MGEKKRRSAIPPSAKTEAASQPPRLDIMVRPCFTMDLQQVQLIYAHHVVTGTGTFEINPPDREEIKERWTKVVKRSWPYLVATPMRDGARILGFAYAQQFRDRDAYSKTFENSIYLAPGQERQGIGLKLLHQLLADLKEQEAREAIAVIGDSANAASIGLHARLGFQHAGVLRNVGFKFGRWLDVVLMQRSL
jgi:phosphinothricin acetyltransferase